MANKSFGYESYKSISKGAGKMAHSVKNLLCKHWDPSLILRTYLQNQDVVMHACNLSAWGDRFLGLAYWKVYSDR